MDSRMTRPTAQEAPCSSVTACRMIQVWIIKPVIQNNKLITQRLYSHAGTLNFEFAQLGRLPNAKARWPSYCFFSFGFPAFGRKGPAKHKPSITMCGMNHTSACTSKLLRASRITNAMAM